jgi:hypothetical protein
MCKFSETEVLDWLPRAETQLPAAPLPGTDLEIRTAQTPGRVAAILAGGGGAKAEAAVVIPIRWMPVAFWPKSVRAGKSSRS